MNRTASIVLTAALFAAATGTAPVHAGDDTAYALAAERQALIELVHRNARAELEASLHESGPEDFAADARSSNARAAASPSRDDVLRSLEEQLSHDLEHAATSVEVSAVDPAARHEG
jgi:hypothetical protein